MLIKQKQVEDGVSLDLTPMIDMVFLLLTFFLAATTYYQAEREMNIALPTASAAVPISTALREIVVNVNAEGGIIMGGRATTEEELREIVRQAVAANTEQKVTIRGDRGTAYANVVRVLDICKGEGIQEPYLDTVPQS